MVCTKLTFDECEALKLSDELEMYRTEAAEQMGVSRQTFDIIIKSARKKIASGLFQGHAICIDGGHFQCTGQASKDMAKTRHVLPSPCRESAGGSQQKGAVE